ncbi:MAG: hypothetical protein OXD31_09510 [Chloroflexi bacterium]|nr:hypothetical protein [Chloroflexota bacterium]
MIEFGSEFAVQVQQGAALVEPIAEQAYSEQNQSIIEGLFRGGQTIIRWTMGAGILVAAFFCMLGFMKLNRAADDPQMFARARNQIFLSIASAGGCTLAFFFIGGGVEFFSTAFGGQSVDVGEVGIVQSGATEIRMEGEFIGMYNNQVVLCEENYPGLGSGALEWTWKPGTDTDADQNDATGQCEK